MATFNIQYANDPRPSLQVTARDLRHATEKAEKRNKYGESFTVTEAGREDLSLAKELALAEAVKYGCSITKEMVE